ncbi:hypothetical protein ACP70R_018036 [Stipagrostis hirtigluma subsp. patula]
MNTSLAMSRISDEKPPSEVSADPSCSRNSIEDDDDWVIVKKQRITILIPPPSPDSASPETDRTKVSPKQSNLTRSKRDWDGARKKHPKQLVAKIRQDSSPENGTGERAQANHSGSVVHKDVPRITVEISLPSPGAPVVKSEWVKGAGHAVQGLFHQGSEKMTNSFRNMDIPRMPIVSSHVASKVMRARLLERKVSGFGGLRNWLFSCGLGWFVDILDSEKLGMYQLVSLTMNQLKEMGLTAVGPRRKLIHAIDSLCRPHQLEI